MSYEEFWEKDYRLVESYVKKHNMDIERETAWSWEISNYIRAALHETTLMAHGDSKSKDKVKDIYPKKPSPRSELGILNATRDEQIAKEINSKIQEKINNINK